MSWTVEARRSRDSTAADTGLIAARSTPLDYLPMPDIPEPSSTTQFPDRTTQSPG